MVIPRAKSCANCSKLQQQLAALQKRLEQLETQNQALEEALAEARTDSTTSAKPPSSDIVKPPKPGRDPNAPQRGIGAQPGHPPHFREPFAPEQVTATIPHCLTCCPDCGRPLETPTQAPRCVQQIDLNPVTFTIEEHQSYASWCPQCQKLYAAPLPGRIEKGGLLGPQLTALVAYLKGACHASFSTIRKFFRDVLAVPISRGQLAKVIAQVTEALEQPYDELLRLLPEEQVVNADETGHKWNGAAWWTWCFRAELYVLYHIDAHRSGDVLMQILGTE